MLIDFIGGIIGGCGVGFFAVKGVLLTTRDTVSRFRKSVVGEARATPVNSVLCAVIDLLENEPEAWECKYDCLTHEAAGLDVDIDRYSKEESNLYYGGHIHSSALPFASYSKGQMLPLTSDEKKQLYKIYMRLKQQKEQQAIKQKHREVMKTINAHLESKNT